MPHSTRLEREEKESDHFGVWISMSNGKWMWLCKFSFSKNKHKRKQQKPSAVWVSMNNLSAYLITMYRSNKNFSDIQQFKVEVNLWSHSFPFDSEGQTDLSAYKNNSNFTTQMMLYYPKLSTTCHQRKYSRSSHQPSTLGWGGCNLTNAEDLVYF